MAYFYALKLKVSTRATSFCNVIDLGIQFLRFIRARQVLILRDKRAVYFRHLECLRILLNVVF